MIRVADYSPLTAPVSRDEVDAWRRRARASGAAWASFPTAQLVGIVITGVIAVVVIVPFVGGVAIVLATSLDSVVGVVGLLFLVGILTIIGYALARAAIGTSRKWERWMRLDRFARANGMRFSPADPNPTYPGAIFQLGSARTAVDHLTTTEGRFLDLGNFRYTTGSGRNRTTRTWGFLALELDRRLPHMVLDSHANNGLFGGTNLPATFDKDQVLSLEGDFDRYFTLYCPREYERDALYVFTPDLMALLIDEISRTPYDVEVIDDWMFVYSSTPFTPGAAATYARLFRIVDTVGAKTVTQTDRYRDERAADPGTGLVAPQGARLKRGVSIGAIITIVAFALVWGSSVVADVIGQLMP